MDVLHCRAVYLRLRLGDLLIDRKHISADRFGHIQPRDDLTDLKHAAVDMRMVVRVRVRDALLFLLPAEEDGEVRADDAVLLHTLR